MCKEDWTYRSNSQLQNLNGTTLNINGNVDEMGVGPSPNTRKEESKGYSRDSLLRQK